VCGAAAAMTDSSNGFAVLFLVLELKDLPVGNIAFGVGRQQKWWRRIDTKLPIMWWAIFSGLQLHLA